MPNELLRQYHLFQFIKQHPPEFERMTVPSTIHQIPLIFLTLFLLSGCSSTSLEQKSPLVLPQHFSITGQPQPDVRWWTVFDSVELNKLVDQALTSNFSLLGTRERIEQSRAVARKSGAALSPELDLEANTTTTRDLNENSSSDSFFFGFAASYELDLWGRLRSSRNALELEAQATESDYQVAALSLAGEMSTTWFQLIESEQQIKLLEKQKNLNNRILELLSLRFRSGTSPLVDVLQQRQLVETNASEQTSLRATIDLLKRQIILLLGNLNPQLPDIPEMLPDLPKLPDTGIVVSILSRRPDVNAALLRMQSSNASLAAAIADRLPRISISGDFTTSSQHAGDLFSNWFTRLGANLLGPLLDGGRRQAEVDRTKALSRQLWFTYGQKMLEAINEVEEILIRERELQTLSASLRRRLTLAAQTIEQASNRYRQGSEDYQRVLSSLLSHQALQREQLKNQRQLIGNRIALYRALSGPLPAMDSKPNQSASDTTQ